MGDKRKSQQHDEQILLALNALIEMAKSGQVNARDLGSELRERMQALAKSRASIEPLKTKSAA